MLVLARKTGETVIVTLPDGREMRVVVVDIDRNKIRLGFTAPDDVKIMREELVRRDGR
jgi:carbon storage regulator CsrA